MPVYTFSTKTKKPEDDEVVLEVKKYCEDRNINFSAIVVEQLRRFREENVDGRS